MRDGAKHALGMAGLSIALYFSGFLVFLTPLPFVYLIFRQGRTAFFAPALAALFFVALVYVLGAGILHPLYEKYPSLNWLLPIPSLGMTPYLSRFGIASIGIGYFFFYLALSFGVAGTLAVSSLEKFYQRTGFAILTLMVLVTVLYGLVISIAQTPLVLEYRESMMEGMDRLISMQQEAGLEGAEIAYLKANAEDLIRYTLYLMPAFMLSGLVFVIVLNLVMSKRLFMAFFPWLASVRFIWFRVPFIFVWGVVSLLAMTLINFKFFKIDALHFLCLNLLLTLAVVYLLQGFAVFVWYIDQKQIFGFLRFAAYMMIFIFVQASALFLVSLGFFDSWMDLRKMDAPQTSSKQDSSDA